MIGKGTTYSGTVLLDVQTGDCPEQSEESMKVLQKLYFWKDHSFNIDKYI